MSYSGSVGDLKNIVEAIDSLEAMETKLKNETAEETARYQDERAEYFQSLSKILKHP